MVFSNIKVTFFNRRKSVTNNLKRRVFSFQNGTNIIGLPVYIDIVETRQVFKRCDHNGGEDSLRTIKYIEVW